MGAPVKRRRKPIPRHLITTVPQSGRCAKCHQRILTCMVYGEPTSLEPVHISLLAEAKALVMNIWTYNVTVFGDGHPFPRSVYHIRDGLPQHFYIVPAHRCGVSWLAATDLDDRDIRRWRGAAQPDECPF